ncbi:MAG TPA: Uma2 family endonuclease [Thermomicrobiales bacterium]|nr:Uma2 family endonuclease [Thermomicrobiales bacterium]
MALETRIAESEFRALALREPDRRWERRDGVAREKPWMSVEHEAIGSYFGFLLQRQLDRAAWRIRVNGPRLRVPGGNYFMPDVAVLPAALERALRRQPGSLDAYAEPLPLVVEIWSPSTGGYDLDVKLDGYRLRGDREIWRIHPYERTLTAWRRAADDSYAESRSPGGIVRVESLPDVAVDLDALLND